MCEIGGERERERDRVCVCKREEEKGKKKREKIGTEGPKAVVGIKSAKRDWSRHQGANF